MATKKRVAQKAAANMGSGAQIDRQSIDQLVQKWTDLVQNESEEAPPLPVLTLQGEAIDLAELLDFHFRPIVAAGTTYPGLESVSSRGEVTANTSNEIRELVACLGSVHARQRVLLEQADNVTLERADDLLAEFRATLGYLLEDGAHEVGEAQLAKLREEFQEVSSQDALAAALEGYSELFAQYRGELEGVGGVNLGVLDEAPQVAAALRRRSADRLTGQIVEQQRDLLRLRNRLASALSRRISKARRAFRFVFRAHPDIVKKAGSAYSRNQRRNYRAKEKETSDEAKPRSGGATEIGAE